MMHRLLLILGAASCLGVPENSDAKAQVISLCTPVPTTSFSMARGGRSGAGFGKDGLVRIWALPEGRLLRTIQISTNDFLFSAFSPDGSRLATGLWNGEVVVWDTTTGTSSFRVRLPKYASSFAFSPDDRFLAVATSFGKVQVLGLTGKGEHLELGDVTGGTQAVVFSPDGALIATADSDTQIRVYDPATGRRVASKEEFLFDPLTIDFTADSKQVVAGGADKIAVFFDAGTGRVLQRLKKQAEPIGYVEVSRDGRFLATVQVNASSAAMPAAVEIWETGSGRKSAEWLPPTGVVAGTWTADGHFLAATLSADAVHIWQAY